MAFRVKIRSGSGSFCLEPFGNRGTHAPYCLLVTFFLRWSTARDRRAGAAIRLLRRPGMPPICSPVCFGSPSQHENPIPAGSRSPRKNDDVNIRLPIYYIFFRCTGRGLQAGFRPKRRLPDWDKSATKASRRESGILPKPPVPFTSVSGTFTNPSSRFPNQRTPF
jgi:hypothetical protein